MKKNPFLIILALHGSEQPAVIIILDCTGHMVNGWKKDADFIMPFFKSKVDEIDQANMLSDRFVFVVQKMVKKMVEFCSLPVGNLETMFWLHFWWPVENQCNKGMFNIYYVLFNFNSNAFSLVLGNL